MEKNNELRIIQRLCKDEFGLINVNINTVILFEISTQVIEREIAGFDFPNEKYSYHMKIYFQGFLHEHISCDKESIESAPHIVYHDENTSQVVKSYWIN